MQLGFSVAGAAFLPVLFASNARWARSRLSSFEELQKHESKALLVLSCVVQVLATCASLSFVCPEGARFPGPSRLLLHPSSWSSMKSPGFAISGA
jgi:hypothetical protein